MNKNYLNLWLVATVFLVLFAPVISNQIVNALGTTSTLTVNTQDLNGVAITGVYIQLYTNGKQIASGYSPATFIVNNTQMYTVAPNNYLTYIFDHWLDTGSTTSTRNISISSDTTITAVYKTASSAVSATPRPPTGLTATAMSSSKINLSWTAPTDNGASAITGYQIERSTDAGSTWSTIVANTTNTATTYSNTGLAASTAYTYRVSAINSAGTGQPSNTASATTFSASTVSQPPTSLTAAAISSSQINLSWTAPANNGGSPITGYQIERSTDAGSTWSTIVANSASTSTTYSDTGLSPNTTYTYRVSAINSIGTSQPSNTVSAATASQPPQPPTSLTAAAISSSQINLSWTAPANNGGSPITGYKIERSTDAGSTWSTILANSASTSTTYSDTGLAASTAYIYRVSAINSVGTSQPSNTASATTTAQSTGITVYAHRIPASYWDPCFATKCSAGTGPGAMMYFGLYDSSGKFVQSGFADENGYTFSGLNAGATYYVYPADCDMCHISFHDVVFQYWGDDHSTVRPRAATVGASLDAWYSCTNGCGLGP